MVLAACWAVAGLRWVEVGWRWVGGLAGGLRWDVGLGV